MHKCLPEGEAGRLAKTRNQEAAEATGSDQDMGGELRNKGQEAADGRKEKDRDGKDNRAPYVQPHIIEFFGQRWRRRSKWRRRGIENVSFVLSMSVFRFFSLLLFLYTPVASTTGKRFVACFLVSILHQSGRRCFYFSFSHFKDPTHIPPFVTLS